MTDYSELKRLAEGATIGDKPANFPIRDLVSALSAFRAECRPTVFLALIAENERLKKEVSGHSFVATRNRIHLQIAEQVVDGHQRTGSDWDYEDQLQNKIVAVLEERDQLKAENERLSIELANLRGSK